MGEAARVDSIDALRLFKVALLKFQEAAAVALGDAESDMNRLLLWVQTEQDTHWQSQIRKRQEIVTRCKEAVRMKKVFKDSAGRQQSAVDEEKALQVALRRLAEAEQKLASTRRWGRVLQKEIELYKGAVQRFATTVHADIPAAVAHLESLSGKLDAYVALQAPGAIEEGAPVPAPAASEPSMARGTAGIGAPSVDEQLRRLRDIVPTLQQRKTALWGAQPRLSLPVNSHEISSALNALDLARTAPAEGAKVLIAKAAGPAQSLYLHRDAADSDDDSGWTIAPADPEAPLEWEAIRVGDLLGARPDLKDLLTLPRGFSVMIDRLGVAAVFHERQAVWRRA